MTYEVIDLVSSNTIAFFDFETEAWKCVRGAPVERQETLAVVALDDRGMAQWCKLSEDDEVSL